MFTLPYFWFSMGHRGRFGHEFMEFEINNQGWLKYSNGSHYRKSDAIRKEVQLSSLVLDQIKEMVEKTGILSLTAEEEGKWPAVDMGRTQKSEQPPHDTKDNIQGRQELEIVLNGKNLYLRTPKFKYVHDLEGLEEEKNLKTYFHLCQQLKGFILSLINVHFKVSPYG